MAVNDILKNTKKQMNLLIAGAALATGAFGMGCEDTPDKSSWKPDYVQTTVTCSQLKKTTAAYDAGVRGQGTLCSYFIRPARFEGEKAVILGFGTPITKNDFVNKIETDTAVPTDIKKFQFDFTPLPSDCTTYDRTHITNASLRAYSIEYFSRLEPKIRSVIPNYDNLSDKGRGLCLLSYVITGGEMAGNKKYAPFLELLNKGEFKQAADNFPLTPDELGQRDYYLTPAQTRNTIIAIKKGLISTGDKALVHNANLRKPPQKQPER